MARTKLAVALVLAGAISASSAHALGLGAIEVKSALNQPLDARIPLLPADEGELETLSISLASPEAFQRAGVDRPFSLTRLRFQVVRGGQPHIRVYTEQPVKEPFLDFLIQADWDRGRLIREFTVLLDPPIYAGAGVAPAPVVQAAPVVPAAGAAVQPGRPAVQAAGVAPSDSTVVEVAPTAAPAVSTYGPVTASDTLWKIANRVRPDSSVSVNQVMIALLRANPEAFIGGDINRLRRGSVLRVPELAQIAAVDPAEANREVRVQLERWRQATAAAQQQQPQGRLQVVAPPAESRDGDEPGADQAVADSDTLERLRRELQTYREANINLQAENEDLKAQIEGLKRELAHFERLLSLTVQQPLATDPAAAPEAALVESEDARAPEPATVGETTAEEVAALQSDVDDAAADHPAEEAAEAAVAEETPAEEPVAEEPGVTAAPAVAPTVPVTPETKEPGFFDEPRNLTTLGGLAVALLALLYLLIRRRRKAEAEQAEAAEMAMAADDAEAALQEEPVAEEAATEEPGREVPAEMAAAADEASAEAEDDLLADNDPLSEAEVYLAYGRYEQARELLETALEQQPEQTELRLKLLETLALLQDEDSFIIHARLLHGQVGDDHEDWRRAREMGREFLPDEPLFSGGATAAEDSPLQQAEPQETVEPEQEQEVSFDIDFDFDREQPAAEPAAEIEAAADTPAEAATDDEHILDFELPEPPQQPAVAASAAGVAEEREQAADELAPLDFDLEGLTLEQPEQEATSDELDFSLSDGEQHAAADGDARVSDENLEDLDEVGIKLNLARAYLDMGDHEGARSLIEEVLAEGSSAQRQEAESLLQQLA